MKKPLKLDPAQSLQHDLERAKAFLLRRQPLPARAALLKVLKTAPDWPPALELMGIVCGELGKPEDSLRFLSRAVAAAPDSVGAHFNLGRALSLADRDEEALKCLDRAIQLRPGTAQFLLERANVLAKLERHEEAEAGYREVIESHPHATQTLITIWACCYPKPAAARQRLRALRLPSASGRAQPNFLSAMPTSWPNSSGSARRRPDIARRSVSTRSAPRLTISSA